MSDENTLDAGSPEDNPTIETTDTLDYEKQYKALLPEYTKQQMAFKDAQSVWEDEQALLARIGEKFPHLLAEEEDETDDEEVDDSSEQFLTRDEFNRHQAELKQAQDDRENQARFNADLKRFVGERELPEQGLAWILSQTHKTADDLQKSVNGWFEYEDSLRGSKKSSRAPHVPSGGKTATGVPDYSEMTDDQAVQAMFERARALESS